MADPANVHQFWGLSPGFDFQHVVGGSGGDASEGLEGLALDGGGTLAPLQSLQCGASDPRFTIMTMCRSHRHPERDLVFYIFEDQHEVLARHMLLISILLDETLTPRDRVEIFLEVFGNANVREKCAAYVAEQGKKLASVVLEASEGKGGKESSTPLGRMFDLSMLKYGDRDNLVDQFRAYSTNVPYDMQKLWEGRMRALYKDRYDFRRNVVDWDYHMSLVKSEGRDQKVVTGSIVHFVHFRRWRNLGQAYESRDDSVYTFPNRSLASMAKGRTVEYRDYKGDQKGRSIARRGYWGDIVNSPYPAWGTTTENQDLFKVVNKQFAKNSVLIAEYNAEGALHELRLGERYTATSAVVWGHGDAKAWHDETSDENEGEGEEGGKEWEGGEKKMLTIEEIEDEDEDEGEGGEEGGGQGAGAADSGAGRAEGAEAGAGGGAAAPSEAAEAVGADSSARADPAPGFDGWEEDPTVLARVLALMARTRVVVLTGDLEKSLLGKGKFQGAMDVVMLGTRYAHLVSPDHGNVGRVLKPGTGLAAVETARYALALKKEQQDEFCAKVGELASGAGWSPVPFEDAAAGADGTCMLFKKA